MSPTATKAGYTPTIGLEVHAELATGTKMFCNSKNDPDESKPNVNICPICLAHPGTLPTINRDAVLNVLRVGTALGSTLADYSEFDRKSYFYPDIPKGYQISQYAYPLVSGGSLNDVAITRVHLEEDTARSIHSKNASLVDFNRAGVPLMELVTEPVIHDAKTAGDFARELQNLLRSLGVSDANLEKGQMRVEANISVSKDSTFGTKVEIKNLNSFRSVERAIAYEIDRQVEVLEKGGKIDQETRGWDESKQETFHQRFKEGSADYRYFPEPDLPKLRLSEIPEFRSEALKGSMPELPRERRARYESLGLKVADSVTIAGSVESSAFFDSVLSELKDGTAIALAANYFISDLRGEQGAVRSKEFTALIRMLEANEISSRGAKDLLVHMKESGGDPGLLAKEHGLMQVSDTEALRSLVHGVLKDNEKAVAEYRGGKETALQYLLGAAMRASKGSGNPAVFREILIEELAK